MTIDESKHIDAKSFLRMHDKSIQDKNNSKNQEIHGELYVNSGLEKIKYVVPIIVAGAIIGVAGHMASKHSMAEDIKATIDREINDDDNFVLDQVRLSEMAASKNYTTNELYDSYKDAKQAIKNKEEGSNIVHFHDKDIEIDPTLVDLLLAENKDGFFSRSDITAEALTLAGMDLYYDLEHELTVEKNNAVR